MRLVSKMALKCAALFLLGACFSALIVPAIAASVTGPEYNFTVGAYRCTNWSQLISGKIMGGTRLTGMGNIKVTPAAQSGHLGGRAHILDATSGQYVKSGTWYYCNFSNVASYNFLTEIDLPDGTTGNYYCQSETDVWNGKGYTTQWTYGTPNITVT